MHQSSRPRKKYDPNAIQRGTQASKIWQDGALYTPVSKHKSFVRDMEESNRLFNHLGSLEVQLSNALRKGRTQKVAVLTELINKTRGEIARVANHYYGESNV